MRLAISGKQEALRGKRKRKEKMRQILNDSNENKINEKCSWNVVTR
jgi:hypothetical protein